MISATSHRVGGTLPLSTFRDAECEVRLYRPQRTIFATHVTGHLSKEGGLAIKEFGDGVLDDGATICMFHEWTGMVSYESYARSHLTKWVVSRHSLITEMTFVVQSRLVAMGIATANLATRAVGINLHTLPDREAFDAALDQAMRARGAA